MDVPPPPAKKPRLSLACNECRRRKVKCDAEYPRCGNCRLRNGHCLTEDPRRPGVAVVREWIEAPSQAQPPSRATTEQSTSNRHGERRRTTPVTPTGPSPSVAGVSAHATSTDGTSGISPVHQPNDMSFNLDRQTNRIKMMGASSGQTLAKSLDVYFRLAQISPVSGYFVHGMKHAEEMHIPVQAPCLPSFPSVQICNSHLDGFFKRIHVLYPVYDIDQLRNTVCRLASVSSLQSLSPEQIPALAGAYLALSLGADEGSPCPTSDGDKFIQAATLLLGHVVLMPHLPSVQCLLLFTIAYRGRNKEGVAWQMIGMAIRIAHSLGLHRFSSVQETCQHGIQEKQKQLFHARIWGICCSLEKMMQLESGRPSPISDVDRDQMMGPEQQPPVGHDFLQWFVGLAKLQGLISDHLYGHKPGTRMASQLFRDTARLDRLMLSWAHEIPYQFRPGTDLLCPPEEFHMAAHMSIQYNQAMIALHRAALVAPAAQFQAEVSNTCADDPSQFRLMEGEMICVNSARSIARLSIEMADRKTNSRLVSVGPQLLSCIVLALYLMKNAARRSQASDLELLRACAEIVSEQFISWGMSSQFAEASVAIYKRVYSHFQTIMRKQSLLTSPAQANGIRAFTDALVAHNGIDAEKAAHPEAHGSMTPAQNGTYSQPHILAGNDFDHGSTNIDSLLTSELLPYSEPKPAQDSGTQPEENMPFSGLNVEDLWNWMLITDTIEANGDLNWTQLPEEYQQP